MLGAVRVSETELTAQGRTEFEAEAERLFGGEAPAEDIIPATTDIIWEDSVEPIRYDHTSGDGLPMNGYNEYWGQYNSPFQADKDLDGMDITSPWCIMCELVGNTDCAVTNNPATNTEKVSVEVGNIRAWTWNNDGSWTLIKDQRIMGGTHYPGQVGDDFMSENGCDSSAYDPPVDQPSFLEREQYKLDHGWDGTPEDGNNGSDYAYDPRIGTSAGNYGLFRPRYSFMYHGYADDNWIPVSNFKAILTQMYARVVVSGTGTQEDLDNSSYNLFMGTDKRASDGENFAELSTGKNKKITSQWQSFNALSFGNTDISKAEFEASNCPFSLEP